MNKVTSIVNKKFESYDVDITRNSKWGNPYTHIKDRETFAKYVVNTREEAIESYREYLLNNKELIDSLHELDGKILGCVCKPDKDCHGDIIIEILTQRKLINYFR